MEWAAFLTWLTKFLTAAAPLFALWLANRKGEKTGHDQATGEALEVNLEAKDKYEEIEQEDRDDGPWIKN